MWPAGSKAIAKVVPSVVSISPLITDDAKPNWFAKRQVEKRIESSMAVKAKERKLEVEALLKIEVEAVKG